MHVTFPATDKIKLGGTDKRFTKTKTIATTAGVVDFNYGALDGEARELAERSAREIIALQTSIARSVVEIGRALLAVQRSLGTKLFAAWREAELSFSQSVCSNYMRAARTFSNDEPLESFSAAALFELSREKVSNAVRETAVSRANAGEKITTSIVAEIMAAEATADANVEAAEPTPAAKPVNDARSAIKVAIKAWPADAQHLVAVRMATAIRKAFDDLGFADAFDLAARPSRAAPSRGAPLGDASRATSLAIGAPVLA